MSPDQGLTYEPDYVLPPGDHLSEWLDSRTMSQAELARRIDLSTKHVNQVVKGNAGLTPDVAIALEKVTSIPARFWMRLEANYRAHAAERLEEEELANEIEVLRSFPVKEMLRRGYWERASNSVGQLRALLRFFGVANTAALEQVVLQPTALRKSKAFEANSAALAAWLRRTELLAYEVQTSSFDANECSAALPGLRSLTRIDGAEWVEPLQERCAEIGIAVVIERELPGCRINGATRWLAPDKAMVALSLRHRRHDIAWFTFFHELAHLLRHSRRQTFIDAEGMGVPEDLERDADRFASRLLIPPEYERELAELRTAEQVQDFASQVGVGPSIVVGRMQHERLIPPSRWQHLIPKYRFHDDN
jgi:HTH-type transcriptional regulator/antitoxin HigA